MKRVEGIFLSNYEKFVKVDNRYYGGNQKWLHSYNLKSKFWSDRSCGVVAAANTLVYMSSYNPKLEGIYEYPDLSKGNYIKFVNELYNHIKPAIYGVHTLNKLNRGMQSFSRTRDFKIIPQKLSRPKNMDSIVKFIKKGLSNNSPVLMVTWNTNVKDLKYHWVTITGYYKTVEGKNFIITSNWGRMQVFSLDDWLYVKSCYKGLIYFY